MPERAGSIIQQLDPVRLHCSPVVFISDYIRYYWPFPALARI